MSSKFSRRRRLLLKGLALSAAGLIAWPLSKKWILYDPKTQLKVFGLSPEIAHHLHHKDFPPPQITVKTDLVLVGSGISGLSAARYLYRRGIRNFQILECEKEMGGNASQGINAISTYPFAAHYLPIPSNESQFLFEFLTEENVITGFNEKGDPYYNEEYLCHDLKERLYLNGQWQEGLVPSYGLTHIEKSEIDRFFQLMEYYKYAKGQDGLYAFSIPLALSSQDPQFIKLDAMTMAEFLEQNAFHSPYLKWYVNYCCRDDYGAGIEVVSAWAGIHYFASRRTQSANSESDAILTWPEGNAFLAKRLAKDFFQYIKTQSLVFDISPENGEIAVTYFDIRSEQTKRILAKSVIVASPRFVAKKFCSPVFEPCFKQTSHFVYSPWLTATLVLSALPTSRGVPLAWDNVSYYSQSMGYIDVQHQSLALNSSQVISYYLPLDDKAPSLARKEAIKRNPQEWKNHVIDDLEKIHPGISKRIQQIDIRLLGHGMICPTKNFIWQNRGSPCRAYQGLFFAHSDMSGISIFEEAYWQGLQTAKEVERYLKSVL